MQLVDYAAQCAAIRIFRREGEFARHWVNSVISGSPNANLLDRVLDYLPPGAEVRLLAPPAPPHTPKRCRVTPDPGYSKALPEPQSRRVFKQQVLRLDDLTRVRLGFSAQSDKVEQWRGPHQRRPGETYAQASARADLAQAVAVIDEIHNAKI